MKFTLNWLKDHLDTEASLEDIAAALTDIGLEVEAVDNPAEKLADFSIAYVKEAKPHPNADKLQLLIVDTKHGEMQVVCGAPNARAGMKGVFAPEGAYIPGSDFTLKPTKIRGVESRGMMCSERELELSDEHDGIIELETEAAVGTAYAELAGLNDPVIEIAITPNRQDCLGVRGIARDLAARGLGTLKPITPPNIAGGFDSPIGIKIDLPEDAQDACPIYTGRLVRGVKNGPAPDWMQRRLRAIGLRPISALVDITNYMSYDLGRPLHVFDADKIDGDLHARLGRKGETFLALDGRNYDVDEDMAVNADAKTVLGLGGIMGGEESGVTAETVNVFLECAYFDPMRTARTGRRTGIVSDARYRFERGVDPAMVIQGNEIGTQLILELCGGAPSKIVVTGEEPIEPRQISLRPARVKDLTGVNVPASESKAILERLGFDVTEKEGNLIANVPSWRIDVKGEADLVEEVIRIHGLNHVPSTPMPRLDAVAKPTLTPQQLRARKVRRAVAGRGFNEAVTWSFIPRAEAENFGGGEASLVLANPIASDMDAMRPSLLPGLLRAAKRNLDRGLSPVQVFEMGYRYLSDRPDGQAPTLGLVWAGTTGERHWRDPAKAVDAFDAKAEALAALAAAGAPVDKLQVAAEAPDWFHPGQSGVLRLGPKNVLASFGVLHPKTAKSFGVKAPVVAAEIYLDAIPLPKAAGRTRTALHVSDLQAVERDFAFLIDADIAADDLLRAARGADKQHIANVALFDVYQGKGVPDGRKSVAIAVLLQPQDATFTDEQIDAISAKIVAAVGKATGGALRG